MKVAVEEDRLFGPLRRAGKLFQSSNRGDCFGGRQARAFAHVFPSPGMSSPPHLVSLICCVPLALGFLTAELD